MEGSGERLRKVYEDHAEDLVVCKTVTQICSVLREFFPSIRPLRLGREFKWCKVLSIPSGGEDSAQASLLFQW